MKVLFLTGGNDFRPLIERRGKCESALPARVREVGSLAQAVIVSHSFRQIPKRDMLAAVSRPFIDSQVPLLPSGRSADPDSIFGSAAG